MLLQPLAGRSSSRFYSGSQLITCATGTCIRCFCTQAWSVILASGTLAPLDSFAGELRLPFHVQLEAPHVVDMRRQVWAGVIPHGPDGRLLTGTYKEVDTVSVYVRCVCALCVFCVCGGGVYCSLSLTASI